MGRQSRRRRGGTRPHGMLRLCCCPRRAAVVLPSPVAPAAPTLRPSDLKLDLVTDLPRLAW